jgi:NAD(P)-dependent dehydrogenase (short-subunit alcohol dehydrogenase family)
VAVVTGAGRGIGRGVALALAGEGAAVACLGRTPATLTDTSETIRRRNGNALAVRCDVTSRAGVFAAVDEVVRTLGPVDILVNNAMELRHLALDEITEEELDRAIRSSLYGSLFAMQAAFPSMRTRGGRVVNFGSAGGTEGWAGQAAYAAAKEAVRGLTKAAAAEWGPYGITVNAVVPTAETDAYRGWSAGLTNEQHDAFLATIPLRRVGDPERDIGRAVVFLVGPDSSYITGRTIFVDGGRGFYDR